MNNHVGIARLLLEHGADVDQIETDQGQTALQAAAFSNHPEAVALLLEHFVNKRTADFKQVIETHILSEISLDELSQLCNMSLSTFKRHFKKIYNTTPNEYLFDKRLEHSKQLLAASARSIDDIALLSGFKTTAHFSRKFKEKYNIPPSQYKLTLSDK